MINLNITSWVTYRNQARAVGPLSAALLTVMGILTLKEVVIDLFVLFITLKEVLGIIE